MQAALGGSSTLALHIYQAIVDIAFQDGFITHHGDDFVSQHFLGCAKAEVAARLIQEVSRKICFIIRVCVLVRFYRGAVKITLLACFYWAGRIL